MSTTDEVIGSIDHALRDFDTSDDAMRWTPEPAPQVPSSSLETIHRMRVEIRPDVSQFVALMQQANERIAEAFREFARKVIATANVMAQMDRALADERRSAMHSAYRRRQRSHHRRNR